MNKDIETFITEQLNASPDATVTDVISLMPGGGKTEYIKSLMHNILMREDECLIVVNDSLEQLIKMKSETLDKFGDLYEENISQYAFQICDKIELLTADNFSDTVATIPHKKVIMMSTQRFFEVMNPSDINNLIHRCDYPVKRIIIDELPYIYSAKDIDIATLDMIDAAINMGISNLADDGDKQTFINALNKINNDLREAFLNAEQSHTDGIKQEFHYNEHLSEASADIVRLMAKYKKELCHYNYKVIQMLEILARIADDGGMVISQKQSADSSLEYRTFITCVMDYSSWFTDIGCKIIVFDGTAKLNPVYDQKFFNLIDCSEHERQIPELTVNIVDIPSSQNNILFNKEYRDLMVDYIKTQPDIPQAIFTMAKTEKFFKDITTTEHFNNIKGKNEFRKMDNIMQVGLNRSPDFVSNYMCFTQIQSKDITMRDKDGNEKIIYPKSVTTIIKDSLPIRYRNKLLLCDIVQNVFRSKIRNTDNLDPVTYNLLIGYTGKKREANAQLVDMVIVYFHGIGATVNLISTPPVFIEAQIQRRKTAKSESTVTQKIISWLTLQPNGRVCRACEICKETDVEQSRFSQIISQDKSRPAHYIKEHLKKVGWGKYEIV